LLLQLRLGRGCSCARRCSLVAVPVAFGVPFQVIPSSGCSCMCCRILHLAIWLSQLSCGWNYNCKCGCGAVAVAAAYAAVADRLPFQLLLQPVRSRSCQCRCRRVAAATAVAPRLYTNMALSAGICDGCSAPPPICLRGSCPLQLGCDSNWHCRSVVEPLQLLLQLVRGRSCRRRCRCRWGAAAVAFRLPFQLVPSSGCSHTRYHIVGLLS
jgi:hypothetical protein